jgi:hypothetical protein
MRPILVCDAYAGSELLCGIFSADTLFDTEVLSRKTITSTNLEAITTI